MPRLLVLGGTEFVGRAVVEEAVRRGWDVTAANRGTRSTPVGAAHLRVDRTRPEDLDDLRGGRWDLVVDTWAWAPTVVRDAVGALAEHVGTYVYVSSRSVYTAPTRAGADESAATVEASPDDGDDAAYDRRKRGGELAVVETFGAERSLLLRAGLILGPHENVGRLPWWLLRVARGGAVLAPGPADLDLQYVDARDLAAFALDAAVDGRRGPVDVVSRSGHSTMGRLLQACVDVVGGDARLVWTDPQVVLDAGVEPWTQLPIWVPPGELHAALHGSDTARARAWGLDCRPVEDTVADTWRWLQAEGPAPRGDRPAVGLDDVVEARLLRGD